MYALTIEFVERMEWNGKINNKEKHRFKDQIATKEEGPKARDIVENMRKELKRLKIVDNRKDI